MSAELVIAVVLLLVEFNDALLVLVRDFDGCRGFVCKCVRDFHFLSFLPEGHKGGRRIKNKARIMVPSLVAPEKRVHEAKGTKISSFFSSQKRVKNLFRILLPLMHIRR